MCGDKRIVVIVQRQNEPTVVGKIDAVGKKEGVAFFLRCAERYDRIVYTEKNTLDGEVDGHKIIGYDTARSLYDSVGICSGQSVAHSDVRAKPERVSEGVEHKRVEVFESERRVGGYNVFFDGRQKRHYLPVVDALRFDVVDEIGIKNVAFVVNCLLVVIHSKCGRGQTRQNDA